MEKKSPESHSSKNVRRLWRCDYRALAGEKTLDSHTKVRYIRKTLDSDTKFDLRASNVEKKSFELT